MFVKLRVLHGTLKRQDGANSVMEVAIRTPRFIIGSAEDCHMRCPSRSISPHHCEVLVRGDSVYLQDLQSEAGTYLNGEQVTEESSLQSGDHLRVGRLEFEVVIKQTKGAMAPSKNDPVADYVSELLVEADQEERATRIADPRLRQFQLPTPDDTAAAPAEPEDRITAMRKKVPQKKPPGKLPPPPSVTSESSVEAAEESLKKIFAKPKKTK
jgi:predicted component of type VI protein secretion system